MMQDPRYKDSAMIALLPTTTDWCRQDLPHLTLVYVGKVSDHKPTEFNELAKDAAAIAMLARGPIMLEVMGVEVFGEGTDDNPKVDALRLRASSELLAMRRMVERWNASEFPFAAHATIGPTGYPNPNIPMTLTFNQVACYWGEDCLPFKIGY